MDHSSLNRTKPYEYHRKRNPAPPAYQPVEPDPVETALLERLREMRRKQKEQK